MSSTNERTLLLGGGLVVGLVLLTRHAKAANTNGKGPLAGVPGSYPLGPGWHWDRSTNPPTKARDKPINNGGGGEPKKLPENTDEPPIRVTELRTPEAAALDLFERAGALIRAGKGSSLGTLAQPSAYVRAAQRAMVMPTGADDGIYGPETRARGKVLTGKTFPIRTDGTPPKVISTKPAAPSKPTSSASSSSSSSKPPAARVKVPAKKPAAPSKPSNPNPPSPTTVEPGAARGAAQAARDLYDRAKTLIATGKGALLGTKGSPSAFVLQAQVDMLMAVADGMYGPATRAAGKALLGKAFPVRA